MSPQPGKAPARRPAEKPPYRVPTMAEIREMPWNGLNVVSTFAGGGGSSTGYRMAGYRVLYANEFIPAAAETYRANARPGTNVDQTDIRKVRGADILEVIGLGVGELDILDGSPPCSAFSTAGKREAGWGKAKAYSDGAVQVVDDLFYEYARLVREMRPRVFVAENVSGLVKGTAKGYFKRILAALREPGYRVEARLLDAQWLGVPQARQRLIFVGVRDDVARQPAFPAPHSHRYAVRDVLPDIEMQGTAPGFGKTEYAPADRPSPTLGASPGLGNARSPASHVIEVFPKPLPYRYGIRDVLPHVARIQVTPHGSFNIGDEMNVGRPAPTVVTTTGGGAWYGHAVHDEDPGTGGVYGPVWREGEPYCPESGKSLRINLRVGRRNVYTPPPGRVLRKLTIPELRVLCSFPPDFRMAGTYEQRWERCGRAVPPLMMRAVAATIAREVFGCAG